MSYDPKTLANELGVELEAMRLLDFIARYEPCPRFGLPLKLSGHLGGLVNAGYVRAAGNRDSIVYELDPTCSSDAIRLIAGEQVARALARLDAV